MSIDSHTLKDVSGVENEGMINGHEPIQVVADASSFVFRLHYILVDGFHHYRRVVILHVIVSFTNSHDTTTKANISHRRKPDNTNRKIELQFVPTCHYCFLS